MTAYSIEPSTAESMTWPAVRTTNMSPRPWSKMISAATRLSAQPNTTAVGFCASARLARCSMLWLGCSGLPATKRSLPSLSAFHAVTGFVFGMADIVPESAMPMIDSTELSAVVRARAARPAVAPTGGDAVADPGQRVHAAADAGGPGRADLAGLGGALADAVGDRRGQRGRRAARLGQARLSAAGQAAARMRDGDRRASTTTWCPRTSRPC